ncbi:MAG TPA: amidohydrolase family protein, partial [Ilumatobacteraceae bacterium]|nr:amidohydrolase family protein [Ilumatobacteraceae bacterium]
MSQRSTVIDNIGRLITNDSRFEVGATGELRDAWVVMVDGLIELVGTGQAPASDQRIDAAGRCVMPGFVDSHSHLVFAGDRSAEFAARMAGKPYEAGGIRTTVEATRAATDDELVVAALSLLAEA